jgi:hypothetical protein
MRRIASTITILAGLMLALGALAPGVAAQDEADDHPLVGAWIVDPSAGEGEVPVEVLALHPDGILVLANPDTGAVGLWEATGERTGDLEFMVPVSDPEAGSLSGLYTIRAGLEVSEDGQTFSGTYTFEPAAQMAEMMGMSPGEYGPAEVTGERMTLEPMGEPVGPMPDFSEPAPSGEPPEEPRGNETAPPADETAPPADETTPPAEETTPPSETPPPVDETTPPAEATASPVADGSPAA